MEQEPSLLRLAAPESPAELAQRFARERRVVELQRESTLSDSLAPFRVGTVPYLNAAPLTRGLEEQVRLGTPAQLAGLLRRDELDAALVSVTEVLFSDRYDALEGIAIASLGEVQSVLLAHRPPLGELTEVHCDAASLASVNLLRVLLAERGAHPAFKTLPDYAQSGDCPAVLLIGDNALDFLLGPHTHQIWDLGAAWYELTALPFVYAVWALRRGAPNQRLRQRLREARDFGLDTLDHIISNDSRYTYDFRKDYLGWHIHYHLGADERRGLAKFMELLHKHGLGPVHEPCFVA